MNVDVAIVGGGMVGASLACALGDSRLKIAVLDGRAPMVPLQDEFNARVSALTLASRNFFQNLGVWDKLSRVAPVEGMQIWDADGEVRFDAADIGEPCLAYIVENAAIQRALLERMQMFTNIHALWPVQIDAIDFGDTQATLALKDGRRMTAQLVIGADGAESTVRRFAGIDTRSIGMDQIGIIAVVRTEQSHSRIARQRFLPTGPLAFLPLAESRTHAIVWSVDTPRAQALMGLSDTEFLDELQIATGGALGRVQSVGSRQSFALMLAQARRYSGPRVALIGDAAHVVHPLAGQGANLGFLDAAVLAEQLLMGSREGVDPGNTQRLRRFERARKGENLGMIAITGGLKYLFGNEWSWIRALRNIGFNLTNAALPAKRLIMRRATGLAGDVPALARSPISMK
jgi:2-octaprenylphenol hydroxylase